MSSRPAVVAAAVVGLLVAGTPALAQVARVPVGARVHVEDTEFGKALAAAVLKKKVPVVVVLDRDKAEYYVTATSAKSQETASERVAKVLVMGGFAGSGRSFEASVTVTSGDSVVIFAHNVKKETIQKAAENVADHLKKHMAGK